MNQQQFNQFAQKGYNRIPVVLNTYADFDTPMSIYLKLGNQPFSYFLESVQGGERFSRYSFIGLPSSKRIIVNNNELLYINGDRVEMAITTKDPLVEIRKLAAKVKVAPCPVNTRFVGGLVGYFGYDLIKYIEPSLAKIMDQSGSNLPLLPEIVLLQSEELAIIDNLTGKLSLVIYADPKFPNALNKAKARLDLLLAKLRNPLEIPKSNPCGKLIPKYQSSKKEFTQAIKKAKDYIYNGDIFQVVLSHSVETPFDCSPLSFYRALRSINPSPYMYYFNFDDFCLVGASPEILVRLQQEQVTVRPIAGTRKRGLNPKEDVLLEQELLADEKENAEHMMLLDLGRNDAGRICQSGSVKVTEEKIIERYSHVMHMVSNVQGIIKTNIDAFEVLAATFPAGTVTGAPKIRAMEIINELESASRGIYSGAVGYIGFNGDMDLAIALRTAIIHQNKISIQAGAGIVADSNPDLEWEETVNKAKALLTAAKIAIEGLDTTFIS